MENLLFTGGTGFLGKNARSVLDKMYEVTGERGSYVRSAL